MGTGSNRLFWNFRLEEILEFVRFELHGNHYAHVGHIGYAQSRGVPMGGEASAQVAAAYCLVQDIQLSIASQCLGFTFFRFRDNLPGIYDSTITNVNDIGTFFETFYNLPMKLESTGSELTTLEMQVVLVDDELGFYMKPQYFDILHSGHMHRDYRIPAKWSPNQRIFLQSVVPSSLLKSIKYASSARCEYIGLINCVFGYICSGLRWSDVLFRLLRYALLRRLSAAVNAFLHYMLRAHLDFFPT